MSTIDTARPWLASYPENVSWDAPIDTTPVFERVLAACARTPAADALDFLGRKTTFGELARAINAFAGALQSRFGVGKGTRVALLLPNTPFYVIAYYGIQRAGGTVVNCNPLYSVPELTHIVSHADADLIVTVNLRQVFDKAEALLEAGHVKSLIVAHFPAALPPLKRVLYTLAKSRDLVRIKERPRAAGMSSFADLLAEDRSPGPVTIDPERDVAVQQYTGGTTGTPKGAMLSHANIAANMSQIDIWSCGIFAPPSRVVAVLPFFHIFAMTACLNVPLAAGAQVVMLPRYELRALLNLVSRTGANLLFVVPTLVQALARAGERAKAHLTSIEIAVSGGAALPDEAYTEWATVSKSRLAEGYGLTEASPVVCCAPFQSASKPMSVGQPLPGTEIRIVEVDSKALLPLGERGEIQVRGPQVMLGYYDDPEATRETLIDGWLRTGDVGYLDEDGYVFLVDRIKDLIISSGFNVYPRTIEEALAEHPSVDEVNVIGVPDRHRGEASVAFVKLRDGVAASEEELKKFLVDRLNKLEMPREIIFKEALPKTLVGKLSKKELRDEYREMKAKTP